MEKIDENFFRLIDLASKFATSKKCFGDDIVSSVDLQFISVISTFSSCSLKMVAAELNITPSACSQQIDRLVKKKYVNRIADRSDRRSLQLILTPGGKKVLTQYQLCRSSMLRSLKRKLSKYPVKDCDQIIQIISDILQKKIDEHGG